jgi:hypothetical protein
VTGVAPGLVQITATVKKESAVATVTVQAVAPPPGRSMLTLDDLQWQGMSAFPSVGNADPNGPGGTSYASGALAVRYVNGRRRLLMPTFKSGNLGETWGDLVEWEEPATRSTDSDTSLAPQLVEIRRWKNWTLYQETPVWQDASNGVRVGGLYWDETTGVVWYQLYDYYSGSNRPLIGATQLLDTTDVASGGDYVQVGAKHGPWWYGTSDPSDQQGRWKTVANWLVTAPADMRAILAGV